MLGGEGAEVVETPRELGDAAFHDVPVEVQAFAELVDEDAVACAEEGLAEGLLDVNDGDGVHSLDERKNLEDQVGEDLGEALVGAWLLASFQFASDGSVADLRDVVRNGWLHDVINGGCDSRHLAGWCGEEGRHMILRSSGAKRKDDAE